MKAATMKGMLKEMLIVLDSFYFILHPSAFILAFIWIAILFTSS
jgi:hypothetical protein